MIFANINIGTNPDDHTGDPLRVAFDKINHNFANILSSSSVGVFTVAGRGGNVNLTVNDVLGAVSVGNLTQEVAYALSNISVPTTTELTNAISQALTDANVYTDSAIGNLILNAPPGLQTIKQLADAIGDDPAFYMQVLSVRDGLALANATIANNSSSITSLWANASTQSSTLLNQQTAIDLLNANVTASNTIVTTNTQNIGTLQSTVAGQSVQIANINANVTAANTAITSLQNAGYATTSYVDTRISNVVGAAPAALDTLKELADALDNDSSFASHVTNNTTAINANVSAANVAIASLQSNAASLASSINTNANNISQVSTGLTAANVNITNLQSNAASIAASVDTVSASVAQTNANVSAANLAIGSLQSTDATHTSLINTINANVSAANATVATHSSQINVIDANVSAANSAIVLLSGTVSALNTTVTDHHTALTTGPISISGNISGNDIVANGSIITTNGIFWANGTAFVSGNGGAASTGNIVFDGDTITTNNNLDAGITFNASGNGEIHIKDFTGVNNSNPGSWFEVGNLTDNINTGNLAINFSNIGGYQGSAVWSWNWSDGIGNGTFPERAKFRKFGLYKNGDLNNAWIEVDADTIANAVSLSSAGLTVNTSVQVTGNSYHTSSIIGPSALTPAFNHGSIPLYVTNNTTAPAAVVPSPDVIARFVGADTGNASLFLDGYSATASSGPIFIQRASSGTLGNAAPTNSGDILGRYVARGRGLTRFSTTSHAGMLILAEGDFTDDTTPSGVVIAVVRPNSSIPTQAARFTSAGNLIVFANTASTSSTTGSIVTLGGIGAFGNITSGQVIRSQEIRTNTISSTSIYIDGTTESLTPLSGTITVPYGGVGVGGNVSVGRDLNVSRDIIANGRVTINSSNDISDGAENEALHVDGGARLYGSMVVGTQLFIGNGAVSSITQNSVLSAEMAAEFAGGAKFTQVALRSNVGMSTASTDFAAYSDNGNDDNGWVDMGFTGSQFNDPLYTITKPNDGYLITRPTNGFGGNLVLATSEAGTDNDIVIGVGSFQEDAEVARFHGNILTGGSFTLQTDFIAKGNLVLAANKAPLSSTSAGTTGQVAYDADYVYVCIAPNTWKRSALSTW